MIQPLNGAVAEGNFEMLDLLMNWSAPHMDGKQIFRERMTSAESPRGATAQAPQERCQSH